MDQLCAVITGDLIGSTAAPAAELERAMGSLADTARGLSELCGADTRFTRHRGDGWQVYIDFPGLCLSAVFQFAAALKAIDSPLRTRQSLGLGRVDHLPPQSLAAARGTAFEASGQGLDLMDRARVIEVHGRGIVTPWHEALVALADWHSRRWSREQAEAVLLSLRHEGATYTELAARLDVSRQAFRARLEGAGFPAWDQALTAFQAADWDKAHD